MATKLNLRLMAESHSSSVAMELQAKRLDRYAMHLQRKRATRVAVLDYVVPRWPSKPLVSLKRHVVLVLFFRFLCLSRLVLALNCFSLF